MRSRKYVRFNECFTVGLNFSVLQKHSKTRNAKTRRIFVVWVVTSVSWLINGVTTQKTSTDHITAVRTSNKNKPKVITRHFCNP
jgi:hypothetical protein